MADITPRLALPLLAAGQAQKEVFHNEALARIDIALQPAVLSRDQTVPPDAPQIGQCWIVAAGATGEWAGEDGALAGWTTGGWRFAGPTTGMSVWVISESLFARFDGTQWASGELVAAHVSIGGQQVVGPRQPAVAAPVGGAVTDAEARGAISAILATLSAHGLTDP